jgi:hypothetical protein
MPQHLPNGYKMHTPKGNKIYEHIPLRCPLKYLNWYFGFENMSFGETAGET